MKHRTSLAIVIIREGLWLLFLTVPFTLLAEVAYIGLFGDKPEELHSLLVGIGMALTARLIAKKLWRMRGKSWPGATMSGKKGDWIWIVVLTVPCAFVAEGFLREVWQGQVNVLITVGLGVCLAVALLCAFRWARWAFIKSLLLRAERGDTRAQCRLAERYAGGKGVPLDFAEAARWYRTAAENGNAGGALFLGLHLAMGMGVPVDRQEAAKWFRVAAEGGIGSAAEMLGDLYRDNNPPDLEEAVVWYRKAVAMGRSKAQRSLTSVEEKLNQT